MLTINYIKLPLLLIGIVLCATAIAQPTNTQIHTAIRQAGSPETFIREVVRQTAQNLPVKTNANVEIVSVAANGRHLMYTTRLVNVHKSKVYDLEALKRSNVNFAACNTPVLGLLIKEYNAKVSYTVLAVGTEFLFQYDLDRRSCEGK